jgi:hypothetical protein
MVVVIAARAKITELAERVDHELLGYPSVADLPAYLGGFASLNEPPTFSPSASRSRTGPRPSPVGPEAESADDRA